MYWHPPRYLCMMIRDHRCRARTLTGIGMISVGLSLGRTFRYYLCHKFTLQFLMFSWTFFHLYRIAALRRGLYQRRTRRGSDQVPGEQVLVPRCRVLQYLFILYLIWIQIIYR